MMAFHEMLITGTELRTACRSAGLGEVTGIALSGGANGPKHVPVAGVRSRIL